MSPMNKQLDIDAINDSKSWAELQKHIGLDEVKKALNARETQRLAHKRYTQKKQLVMERAKELQKEKPELFQDLDLD